MAQVRAGMIVLMVWWLTACPLRAAPLDVDSTPGWVRDAMAALVARGLVEGYPDGTFRGDRCASRWEVALVVARLLARMQQEHASFANRSDLEAVQGLAAALGPELQALGVRLTQAESAATRLDQRVTELERIHFYGSVETKIIAQGVHNTGAPDNDNQRGGAGTPSAVPYANYNQVIGNSGLYGTLGPQVTGVFPVTNWLNGRPLTNGTGYSTRADLGMNVKVSDELEAGLEFASYTTQGSRLVDGYWGVQAPWLASPAVFEVFGVQSQDNLPFTKTVLDHFWIKHLPSGTQLTLGYLDHLDIDPLVYAGRPQIGPGPLYFPGFGSRLNGKVDFSEDDSMLWETFISRVPQAQVYLNDQYLDFIVGADLAYQFDKGAGLVRLNVVRLNEQSYTGEPLQTGLMWLNNTSYGSSNGWSVLQWVNPPGYFVHQLPLGEQQSIGKTNAQGAFLPNPVDTRPIAGWNGFADNAVGMTSGGGNYGPQAQTGYGATARYLFDFDESKLHLKGLYAHTDYQSNSNSDYHRGGDAWGLESEAELPQVNLDLTLRYISVDPTYSPFMLLSPMFGLAFPVQLDFTRAQLHDFINYPRNRQGPYFSGTWKYDEGHGTVDFQAFFLSQKQTSLYDVRVPAGALGPATPTGPVLGFAPGYFDQVFSGFANPNVYGPSSFNSFTSSLSPLENPRGTQQRLGLGGSYHWDDPDFTVDFNFRTTLHHRPTSLSVALGGSQNYLDIFSDQVHLGTHWDPAKQWSFESGLDLSRTRGHLDPAGLYNTYALDIGSTSFRNLDTTQTVPYLSANWQVTEAMSCNLLGRYYFTTDHIPTGVFAGTGPGSIGATVHPFSWQGLQLISDFSLKF